MGIETRVCKRCGKEQPLTSEFFRQKKNWFEHTCKQCGRDAMHAYHLAHQEEECAKARAVYWADPEKERKRCRDYMREIRLIPERKEREKDSKRRYYQRNKVRILAKSKERQLDPSKKQHDKERSRVYYLKHRDRILTYNRERYKTQAAVRRLGARNRHARQKGCGEFTPKEIMMLFEAQKGKCWWCGKPIFNIPYGYDIDHRIPTSRGGSNKINNLVLTCPHCNRSKNDKLPHEWSDRLL